MSSCDCRNHYASSQVRHRFLACSLQISSCDCGEYACAELAAIITYRLRFLTCSLQISSCDCGEYVCSELATIITYPLRFFTDSWHVHYKLVLVIAVNMHAQSLPQSLHIVSDSSQILDMFIVHISSCDCGEYACAELAANITYQLKFFTDSWHVHYKLVLVTAVNMHAQSLPQYFYASSQVRHRFLT